MTAHRAGTPLVAVVVVLFALLSPSAARAGDLLGGRLDTSGQWVQVVSKATIPVHIVLTTEGDITLTDAASFDLAPGDVRRVAFVGSGLGWVSARMTPRDVPEGASSGALELKAWVRYVVPQPGPPWAVLTLVLFLLILAAVASVAAIWSYRHARI
jgi:hypothetical protein